MTPEQLATEAARCCRLCTWRETDEGSVLVFHSPECKITYWIREQARKADHRLESSHAKKAGSCL